MHVNFEIVARPSRARGFSYIGVRVSSTNPQEKQKRTRAKYQRPADAADGNIFRAMALRLSSGGANYSPAPPR